MKELTDLFMLETSSSDGSPEKQAAMAETMRRGRELAGALPILEKMKTEGAQVEVTSKSGKHVKGIITEIDLDRAQVTVMYGIGKSVDVPMMGVLAQAEVDEGDVFNQERMN